MSYTILRANKAMGGASSSVHTPCTLVEHYTSNQAHYTTRTSPWDFSCIATYMHRTLSSTTLATKHTTQREHHLEIFCCIATYMHFTSMHSCCNSTKHTTWLYVHHLNAKCMYSTMQRNLSKRMVARETSSPPVNFSSQIFIHPRNIKIICFITSFSTPPDSSSCTPQWSEAVHGIEKPHSLPKTNIY